MQSSFDIFEKQHTSPKTSAYRRGPKLSISFALSAQSANNRLRTFLLYTHEQLKILPVIEIARETHRYDLGDSEEE